MAMQGDAYRLPVQIKVNGENAKQTTFDDLEICVGNLRKVMSEGGIAYDADREVFLVYLEQKETFRLRGKVEIKIRCKFVDGEVVGINAGTIDWEESLSKVVL